MPCLNEAQTIGVCIRKARACIDRLGLNAEIVIADNGSTDGSQAIAEREGARVVAVPERGYGAALYHGALGSRGRYIIMGDADDSYDFSRLDPFVEKLREGNDLVMGNRFRGSIAEGAMPWKNRYIGNPALSFVGRLFFRCPVADFHCGIRGFSRAAFDRMDLQTTGCPRTHLPAARPGRSGCGNPRVRRVGVARREATRPIAFGRSLVDALRR